MVRAGCVFVAGIHPSRTWTSGSFESVGWNACVHRLDLGLYSHPKEFWGNGVWTHVNSKGKIPSTGKCPQRSIEPATLWQRAQALPTELFRPLVLHSLPHHPPTPSAAVHNPALLTLIHVHTHTHTHAQLHITSHTHTQTHTHTHLVKHTHNYGSKLQAQTTGDVILHHSPPHPTNHFPIVKILKNQKHSTVINT